MLLAVDVGNTNVTVGLFGDGADPDARRTATTPRGSADELELLLDGLLKLDGRSLADVDALACASVVPAVTASLESLALRRGIPCFVATAGTVPIAIRVERRWEVGADRLVNAFAAGRLHRTPAVVVDLGTATTVDAVDADGAFAGGAIAPGLVLGLEALAARTAKLPRIELRTPERAIGRDTVEAMQAGAIFGYRALAAGLLERVRRELAERCDVDPAGVTAIATGGLSAAPWTRDLAGIDVIDPDLTLRGLALLHAEARGGASVVREAT
jgi:type III pantothenate kinase